MKVTGKTLLSGTSLAIGIIGVLLSIYFYEAQKQFKALSFVVDPKHALVLSPQRLPTAKLTIFDQDGKQITRNVYSAELFLWNSGTETILGTDVIVPLVVEIPKGARFLDLQPLRVSRSEVTQASADIQPMQRDGTSTQIRFQFRVLEPSEGIRVSCLYEGQGDEEFAMEGGVIGIRKITDTRQITQDRQVIASWKKRLFPLALISSVALSIAAFLAWRRLSQRLFRERAERVEEFLSTILVCIFALAFLTTLIISILQPWIHPERATPENIRTSIPSELTHN